MKKISELSEAEWEALTPDEVFNRAMPCISLKVRKTIERETGKTFPFSEELLRKVVTEAIHEIGQS